MSNNNRFNKLTSLLLALIMIISITGCSKDETDDNGITTLPPDSQTEEQATQSSGDTTQIAPRPDEAASDATTTAPSTTTTKAPTVTKTPTTNKTQAPTKAPAVTSPPQSSAPSGPVQNAATTDDLANVDPQQAANQSYDTYISINESTSGTFIPTEYVYVSKENFKSHILEKWQTMTVVDKVKIDTENINEYLNFVCLPLKDSFFEINCNGYNVNYRYDPTGMFVYMEVKWHYYVSASQYNTCRTKAAELVASVSGNTVDKMKAIHDTIGINTIYKAGIDGAYNCLVNKTCDCDGYTATFKLCMDIMGVPCKAYATSNHIFNLVQVNGKWYIVDVTYDDQTSNGFISPRYFLIGDSLYQNHPVLQGLPLSKTDYGYSQKIVITDDLKFKTFLGIDPSINITAGDDGNIYLDDGRYYTITWN